MAGLRSAIVLKYMISIKEDISYPELIIEIHCHTQAKKTSDLKASKLNQDILLGGKHKINSQAGSSKPKVSGNENGKNSKLGTEIMEILITTIGTKLHKIIRYHGSVSTPPPLYQSRRSITRMSIS